METTCLKTVARTLTSTAILLAAISATTNTVNAQSVLDRPVSSLKFTVITGNDDMRRGGYAIINQKFNARYDRFCRGSGCGNRWVRLSGGLRDNTSKTVSMRMKRGTTLRHFSSLEIYVNRDGGFGGGLSGDNWNVNRVVVQAVFADDPGRSVPIMFKNGSPRLKRFTGDSQKLVLQYDF